MKTRENRAPLVVAFAALIVGFLIGGSPALAAPVADLSPPSKEFGQQLVGTESGSFDFTLNNTGDGSISVASIGKAGNNPGQFKIKAGGTCEANQTVLDETLPSCTVRASFKPGSTGNKTATIEVRTDLSSEPLTVTVTGRGINPPAPRALLSSSVIPFSKQAVGSGPSTPRTVILTSTGSLPLEVGDISIAGLPQEFPTDVLKCENKTFQPGESCTFTISFQPAATGTRKNVITILTNASSAPLVVRMAGTGVAPRSEGSARLKIASGKLRAKRGSVFLPATCSVDSMDRCAGRVRVFVRRSVFGNKATPNRLRQVTGGTYAVRKGRAFLRFRLNRPARRALARRGGFKATIETRVRQAYGSVNLRRVTRKIRLR